MQSQKISQDPIEGLFNYSHVTPSSILDVILLLFYLPIGIGLLLVRICGFLVLAALLLLAPADFQFPIWLSNLLFPMLGMRIKVVRPPQHRFDKKVIIASNHVSAFDVFPFLFLSRVNVLVDKGFYESNPFTMQFNKIAGAIPIDRAASKASPEQQKVLYDSIHHQLKHKKHPLLFFPEGWDTNGKQGVLIFQKFLFSLGYPIMPVATQISIPWLPMLNPGVLGTSILKELMFMFFVPFYLWELSFLDVQTIGESERPEEFARRTQIAIAAELGISPTEYSFKDALAHRLGRLSLKGYRNSVFFPRFKQR
eukprot:TRINITY_DN2414_c0_g1_i1.p1 TRINITY_DN2414_c0_g1~~TRINITY_DN2414_c0_g1_i1.p1  ORF type:complete len:310 (+),score=46.12 TRINITY_DN2414_c0_g1_i1:164-1093(+)